MGANITHFSSRRQYTIQQKSRAKLLGSKSRLSTTFITVQPRQLPQELLQSP
jgi:hypothetical protein